MAKQHAFDPLSYIPSPEAIQRHLQETELLASRLRLLLRVSKRLNPPTKAINQDSPAKREAVECRV
jgi:hypothetical protein